jgi:hypothetical protein
MGIDIARTATLPEFESATSMFTPGRELLKCEENELRVTENHKYAAAILWSTRGPLVSGYWQRYVTPIKTKI